MKIPNTVTFVLGKDLAPRLDAQLQRIASGLDPVMGLSFSKLMRAFVEEALEAMEKKQCRNSKR